MNSEKSIGRPRLNKVKHRISLSRDVSRFISETACALRKDISVFVEEIVRQKMPVPAGNKRKASA